MALVRFDITSETITADIPMISHRVCRFCDGSKLFAASLGNGIDFLLKASDTRDLSEEFYSRKIKLFDRDISVVYANFLQFVFYRVYEDTYIVSRVTGDGERQLGILGFCGDCIKFNSERLDASKLRSLYAKFMTLRQNL